MSRTCPTPKCRTPIADRMFVCQRCWLKLEPGGKKRVVEAFQDYKWDVISLTQFREVQAEVLADWLRAPASQFLEPERVRTVVCTGCAGEVVLADRTLLTHDDAGDLVVVGGRIVAHAGHGPSYARFRIHKCVAAAATPTPKSTPSRRAA